MKTETMSALLADFLDTLEKSKAEILAEDYPEDRISEEADSAVPIYNGQLADLLASDNSLAEPDDSGLAEEVTNVWKLIQIACYEQLSNAGSQWLNDAQEAGSGS